MNFSLLLALFLSAGSTEKDLEPKGSTENAQSKLSLKSLNFGGEMVREAIKKTCKKHLIYPIGTGTGGDCLKFSVDYQINKPISKDEARFIILDARDILIDTLNNNKKYDTYYRSRIFSKLDVSITLFISGRKGNSFVHPQISVAECNSKKVEFLTNDPENLIKFKKEIEETLEEAEAKNREYLASFADGR